MKLFLAAALSGLALSAQAADIHVKDPWVRATVAEQKATGAFMQITAPRGARLVEARSPLAGVTEIHEMTMQDNVMRMRAVKALELPAGKQVDLKPGGYHIMLMDLKSPVIEGSQVPLTLVIENADRSRETVDLRAPVRGLTAGGPEKHEHPHH
ncbi:copper chaperone PCu(A)C [Methyloversatilis thermotolerans]|uniref:copper chaperone PCu(A)C n=1 Tax=Methyloversatilis thermotolerans TaxID=1346290 RepID=UPI0003639A14|nr:copper chaperone PCu(A)C [Methyloversatilis thermotolerans]